MDKTRKFSNTMNIFRYKMHFPFIQRVAVMSRGTRVEVDFNVRYMSFNEPSQLREYFRLLNEKNLKTRKNL